eukprot:g48219.t1
MKHARLPNKRANAPARARDITGAKRHRSVCRPTKHARRSSKCARAEAQAQASIGAKQRRSVCHLMKHVQILRSLVECCIRQPRATSSLTVTGMMEQTHAVRSLVECCIRQPCATSSLTVFGMMEQTHAVKGCEVSFTTANKQLYRFRFLLINKAHFCQALFMKFSTLPVWFV